MWHENEFQIEIKGRTAAIDKEYVKGLDFKVYICLHVLIDLIAPLTLNLIMSSQGK